MIELNLKCESSEEARTYLNAPQYLCLLQDLERSLCNARKHGNDADVLRVVETFLPEIAHATDHATGPY